MPIGTSFCRRGKECAEFEYYATPPRAVCELLKLETFSHNIWDPCCGGGHIVETLKEKGYNARGSDLFDHGYGMTPFDFLQRKVPYTADIITNPPYNQAQLFVEHALSLLTEGHKLAMFLRIMFLETKARRVLFEKYPPKKVYVASSRLGCAPNGEFKVRPNGELYYPSSVVYAWFIWEYGYSGETKLGWFN